MGKDSQLGISKRAKPAVMRVWAGIALQVPASRVVGK